MSDITHNIYIFSLKSVGRLVRWSPLLTLSPKSPGFKPQTGQKRRTKNQNSTRRSEIRINFFTDSIRNQQPKLRAWIFRVILRDRNFEFCKKNIRNHARSFGWIWKVLISLAKKNLIANFHVLELFKPKQRDKSEKKSVCHAALPWVFGRNLRRS
jgi:hypothetical protein